MLLFAALPFNSDGVTERDLSLMDGARSTLIMTAAYADHWRDHELAEFMRDNGDRQSQVPDHRGDHDRGEREIRFTTDGCRCQLHLDEFV